jgi:hypothetical protein
MEERYDAPKVTDLGNFAERTQDIITKTAGNSDVIVIGGASVPVPGSSVLGVSH